MERRGLELCTPETEFLPRWLQLRNFRPWEMKKGDPEPKERMYGSLKSPESEKKERKRNEYIMQPNSLKRQILQQYC
jgi:hypothetical protein